MTQQNPTLEQPPALPVYYMKILAPQVDARLGKLKVGAVVALDQAKATRYLASGIAEQVSSQDYQAGQERKQAKSTARQEAFRSLNEGHAVWDVSTYRDVLTAPESGLRIAWDRGIPLVNVHVLRDEDGDVLSPDADIEDILEARRYLHADLTAPLAAHDRSSVMGGGSPYTPSDVSGPMPLSPMHRAMAQSIADNDRYAQQQATSLQSRLEANQETSQGSSRAPTGRAGAAQRRADSMRPQPQPGQTNVQPSGSGNVTARPVYANAPGGAPMPPTPPPAPSTQPQPRQAEPTAGTIAPGAEEQARDQGVSPPRPARGTQIGNGPEPK